MVSRVDDIIIDHLKKYIFEFVNIAKGYVVHIECSIFNSNVSSTKIHIDKVIVVEESAYK